MMPSRLWLRYWGIGAGIFILFWLPIEDASEQSSIIIAITISILLATRYLINFPVDTPKQIFFHALIGSLAGAGAILMAIFLLAFKSGLHNHDFPDYSSEQFINIARFSPFLIASGFLLSLSGALWRHSHPQSP